VDYSTFYGKEIPRRGQEGVCGVRSARKTEEMKKQSNAEQKFVS
jgi:hypothetical protein